MTSEEFLQQLQEHAALFASAVVTNEGEWIIKGFIDIYKRIYTISVDTKIVSKVLELLLFPMFLEFALKYDYEIELSPHQNFYPDLAFTHKSTLRKFAVDIKSTYRTSKNEVNGMTLGAFTGYFRNRESIKNTTYPYNRYTGHFVLGVIYSRNLNVVDERKQFSLDELEEIPSVIRNFQFFAQPKYKIASSRPGSGNTKNIGSVTQIDQLLNGSGTFAILGEEVYDDYWMYYLTADMARSLEISRPYTDLKSYLEYKQRGQKALQQYKDQIENLTENTSMTDEDEMNEN